MTSRRIRAAVIAGVAVVLLAVGILTGAFQQFEDDGLPQLGPGESFETSLLHVEIQAIGDDEGTVIAQVRATVTAEHPVPVRDVFAFRVDGEPTRFTGAHAGEASVTHLNPAVPVDLALSYSPRDGEDSIELLILDGRWETQNENALALPDHLVLIEPVAVVVE